MRTWILLLFGTAACLMAQPQPLGVNDTARFLAGLSPSGDSSLQQLAASGWWRKHADSFDSWWSHRTWPQLQKVSAWAAEELGAAHTAPTPVFYFFSGPDIAYVERIFSGAQVYVLCGKEPVGNIPALTSLSEADLSSSLGAIQNALKTLMNYSYFITEDMKSDLRSGPINGVLPLLFVLLARNGNTVVGAEAIYLNPDGQLAAGAGSGRTPGIKITFQSPSVPYPQTVVYFSSDLSNSGLRSNSAVTNFCRHLGKGNSFLKSASYLLHLPEFSTVRNFLLNESEIIVQDDSGIPLKDFLASDWTVRAFGKYVGPIELFQKHYQADMAQRFAISNPKPLEFGMGYRFRPDESAILVAFRKGREAQPVPQE